MQHPEELRTRFVELRARNVSYDRISKEIGVSKPTLIQWGRVMADTIADLQAAEREMVKEKLLGNFEQWLGRQVNHFDRLDKEFGGRELRHSPTESVFRMMMASRQVIEKLLFDEPPLDRPRRGRDAAPSASAEPESEIQNPESKIENPSVQSIPGVFAPILSCPLGTTREHSPCSVTEEQQRGSTKAPQNPCVSQPFPHQDKGGRDATPLASAPKSAALDTTPAMSVSDSQISNMKSELTVSQPQSTYPQTLSVESGPSVANSQPDELEPDDFIGSIAYTPGECAQGIIQKCLEAEAAHHRG
jgi:hypothetical protein